MTTDDHRMSRRDFDRALSALGVSLLTGCHSYQPACSADAQHTDPLDGYTPRFLTRAECLTLAATAEIMIGACSPAISAVEVARRADQLLAATDAPAKAQMQLALHLIESFAGLLEFDFRSFSELALDKRRDIIQKFVNATGLERDATKVLKLLTVVPYYSHPDVRRALGFVEFDRRSPVALLPVVTERKKHPEPEVFG